MEHWNMEPALTEEKFLLSQVRERNHQSFFQRNYCPTNVRQESLVLSPFFGISGHSSSAFGGLGKNVEISADWNRAGNKTGRRRGKGFVEMADRFPSRKRPLTFLLLLPQIWIQHTGANCERDPISFPMLPSS